MNLLAVDSSSANVSVSIMRDSKIIVDFNRLHNFGASKIIYYINKYLKKLSFDLKDFDAFVIGSGPGSFTGLRISFSIIKGFVLALNKPVISIGSFFSLSYPFKKEYNKIAVISDARRNMVYAASYISKDDNLRQEAKEKLTTLEEAITTKKDYFFVTYDEHLRNQALSMHPKINFYSKNVYPKAKNLLMLAQEYYLKEKFTPLGRLEPLYLHPKTCQIRGK
jgi:tRNA threonylcarbamoyladenosine biosynthesis protein TsaB